ncbi:MAG: hypothetical protein AAGL89_00055 [Pseudomonadota bacterium]
MKRQKRALAQWNGRRSSSARPGVVLMLHVGRCGSTVLANLLGQNDEIFWDGKIPRKAKQLYHDTTNGFDYARWTRAQFDLSGGKYYGFEFKILADQYPAVFGTTTEEFLETCRRIGVTHYVLLVRRNTLRHVVSHYASKNRGSWHAGANTKVEKKTFVLDPDDITTGQNQGRPLLDYLFEVDAAHDLVRSKLSGENFLELEYEGDIDEPGAQSAYNRICEFLKIAPGNVAIKNRKMNPFPLSDVIENHEDLAELLSDTPYAWMLNEPETHQNAANAGERGRD